MVSSSHSSLMASNFVFVLVQLDFFFFSLDCSPSGMAYEHLVNLIRKVDDKLTFDWSDKYGWLTINPLNIGSSIRCTVRIRYAGEMAAIEKFCKLNDIRLAIGDERSGDGGCFVEVSNGKVFGLSEFECLKLFYDNLIALGEVMKSASHERNEHQAAADESRAQSDGDAKNANHSAGAANGNEAIGANEAAAADGHSPSGEMPSDEVAEHAKNDENEISASKESINDEQLGDGNIAGNGHGEQCSGQANGNDGNADAGGNGEGNGNEATANADGAAASGGEQPSGRRQSGGEPNAETQSQGKSNDDIASDGQPIDGGSSDEKPDGERLNDELPTDGKPNDEAPNDENANEGTTNEDSQNAGQKNAESSATEAPNVITANEEALNEESTNDAPNAESAE